MEAERHSAGLSKNGVSPLFPAEIPPAETPIDPRNRRAHPRYIIDVDSNLLLVSHGLSLPSHILDLSLEGCRLRTQERYTAGTQTRVEVTFKVNGIAFRFLGVTRWADGGCLVGVRFIEMASRRREQLAEVICEIEAAAAARAAREAAEKAAAESEARAQAARVAEEQIEIEQQRQAEELDGLEACMLADREARQWAEIQEIARAKAAREQSALLKSHPDPEKSERRIQQRHQVDTAATIFLIKIASTAKGHIYDLSMSGCRIRCDERFPVGIYTRVEIEFCLGGLPFRLGGVIQTIHDPHNVGIRFLDVSLRKREQVEQLIAEIAAHEAQSSMPAVAKKEASEAGADFTAPPPRAS